MEMLNTLLIPWQLNQDLLSLSQCHAPREACGLLLGKWTSAGAAADQFIPLSNEASGVDRFRIDPRNYREIERRALDCQKEILGVFHSHPQGRSAPSNTDLRHARELWGEGCSWVYVICGLEERDGEEIRSWQLRKGVFTSILVEISGASGEFLHGY